MKPSPGLTLAIGLWLGATLLVFVVVSYNFVGIRRSVAENPRLAENAGFSAEAKDSTVRQSVLYVYAGELNRALFYVWNRTQIGLAALTLFLGLMHFPRAGLLLSLTAAGVIVLTLTFYLGPEVTNVGRQLDFVARDAVTEATFARFRVLHLSYVVAEGVKTVILALASFLALHTPRPS